MPYLCRSWEHSLAGIQFRTTSILNLLNLAASTPNDASHSRVGDNKLDRNGTASWHRRSVEWFVVNAANDQAKALDRALIRSDLRIEYSVPWTPHQAAH